MGEEDPTNGNLAESSAASSKSVGYRKKIMVF